MLVNSSRWYQSSYSLTAEIYDFSTFIHCVRTNVCRLHLPTCICEGVHLCEYIGEGVCHLVREGGQKLDEGNDLFFSLGSRLPPFLGERGHLVPRHRYCNKELRDFTNQLLLLLHAPHSFYSFLEFRFVRSLNRIFMYIYSLRTFHQNRLLVCFRSFFRSFFEGRGL